MKNETLIGVRISNDLRDEMKRFCRENGIKMSFFVEKAIQERLHQAIAVNAQETVTQEV